jgi:hypothetical protein
MSGYRVVERGKRPLYFEDLYCHRCESRELAVTFKEEDWPECCGAQMKIAVVTPRRTDCYSAPRYSEAGGKFYSSRREQVADMKAAGFEEAGDKVGGARTELSIKESSFSYPGKVSRMSTAERSRERKVTRALRNSGAIQ